jgi:flagellar assembly protein FliH
MPDFERPNKETPEPAPTEPAVEMAKVAIGPSESELDEIRKEAEKGGYRTGFESGYEDGKRAAREELEQDTHHLRSILDQLVAPLDMLDQSLETDLAQIVGIIGRQLIHRELSLNEGQIVSVVRETVGLLPIADRQVTLYLNPEDAVLVRDALALDVDERPWGIVDDPLLARGGCRVVSGPSQIDATVESRLNRLVARLLGGRRQEDDADKPVGED